MIKRLLFLFIILIFASFVFADLNTSLVSYYTFDNTLLDALGNNDITSASATYTASGKINGAYDFDGVNDYMTTTNNFDFGDVFSVNVWIKEVSGVTGYIISSRNGATPFWVIQEDGSDYIIAQLNGGSTLLSSNVVTNGSYQMITLTLDGSNASIYVDGQYRNSVAMSTVHATENINIGSFNGGNSFWKGEIDEIAIYIDLALTGDNITQLYNDYLGCQYPFSACSVSPASNEFLVTAVSDYSGSSISNFSVFIEGYNNLSTTNGTINTGLLQNNTNLYNLTFYSGDWFSNSYLDTNISSNLQAELNQSYINITPKELFTNISISNFSIKIGGVTKCNVTGTWCLVNFDEGDYNISLIDNTGVETFHTTGNELGVSALDNVSFVVFGHGHEILIYAHDINTGSSILTFNASLSSYNISDERTLSTTNGEINFDVIHNNYLITIDAVGYALFNNSVNISVDSSQQNFTYNFSLYSTNSFNFVFKDAVSLDVLTGFNITLDLISDLYSNNFSTNNGTLYVDLLSPEFYTIRFFTDGFTERFYYFTLVDRSYNEITLYLLNDSLASNITLTITDENNKRLSNAYVKVLRYDLTSNSYLLQEIYKTDVEGKAYIEAEINKEFYKFYIDYPFGTSVYFGSPDYIQSTSFIIPILLDNLYGAKYFNSLGVSGEIVFNNVTNNWRWDFSDNLNTISGACLYVYELSLSNNLLLNSSCVDTSSGSILIGLVPENSTDYRAVGVVLYDGQEYYWGEKPLYLTGFKHDDSKEYRLSLIMFLTLLVILLFIWDISLLFLFMPVPLLIGSLTEYVEFDKTISIGFMLVGVIISYWTNKSK